MILSRSFLFLRLDRIRQKMAGAVGLELTTCGFGDRCSSQLSYTPACSGFFTQQPGPRQATLLGLLVHCMLALKLAVFLLLAVGKTQKPCKQSGHQHHRGYPNLCSCR